MLGEQFTLPVGGEGIKGHVAHQDDDAGHGGGAAGRCWEARAQLIVYLWHIITVSHSLSLSPHTHTGIIHTTASDAVRLSVWDTYTHTHFSLWSICFY